MHQQIIMLRERRRHANFKPNRKLDRKSSRGMIYENEELRIRTININAEVERGQSDIKKLLRENYRLRTENWTLRDEYDRLDKLLKTKGQPNGHSNSIKNLRDFCDLKCGYDFNDSYRCCNCFVDNDNISCDMCNNNKHCVNDVDDPKPTTSLNSDKCNGYGVIKSNKIGPASMPASIRNEKINMNFDHLSVVSEECLSNSDEQTNQTSKSENVSNAIVQDPIYNNFQSSIPPLKHFENLSYKDIGPNIDSSGEIHFDGEMYQSNEPTPPPSPPPPPPSPPPPPPSPPPSSVSQINRRSASLPLPPPPTLIEEGNIIQDMDKPLPNYFFSPLKSKRKSSTSSELRPDVFVNNILPSDSTRLATIRKPHNPLKCPSGASIDEKATIKVKDVHGLSKGMETMQMQTNRVVENVTSSDSDQTPPYRTEMSLVLSYSGNKSKYSTTQNAGRCRHESDVETPPPNLPQAMKLLPNKLPYTGKNEALKQTTTNLQNRKNVQKNLQEVDHSVVNTEISANDKILSRYRINSTENPEINGKRVKNNEKFSENDEKHGYGANGDSVCLNENNEKESNPKSKKRNSNESQESKETGESSKNSNENMKDSRRVSIHFNGKSITDQPETVKPHSNDCDLNNMTEEEILAIPPVSYLRSRRTSYSRKVNDEIGTFLYPPNPFIFSGAYKRGRRPSFLSRRHSEGVIVTQPTQYLDYGFIAKPSNRCQCHSTHNNHLDVEYCGECCNNMGSGMNLGESNASSICNNIMSSHESLESLSQQSSRRKISITSHSKSGGKIPWCGCWGNGCI